MLSMPDHTKALSVQEAADLLGVSARTMRRWDKDGKLKAARHPINGYRCYFIEDIERYRPEAMMPTSEEKILSHFKSTISNIEDNPKLREPQRQAHRE